LPYLSGVAKRTGRGVTNPAVDEEIRQFRMGRAGKDRVEQTHIPAGPLENPEKPADMDAIGEADDENAHQAEASLPACA
jgi:hypothetical protein